MSMYKKRPMNPYLGGALAGILSIGSVALAGKYFGASTTFVRATAFLERIFSPERIAQMPYFVKDGTIWYTAMVKFPWDDRPMAAMRSFNDRRKRTRGGPHLREKDVTHGQAAPEEAQAGR